jgi:hypothetical protein
MALAGVGLWLTGSSPPVEVKMDAGGYTVDGARLDAQGGGAYQSAHGVMVVRGTRSALSTSLGNEQVTGVCDQDAGSGSEHCRFTQGGRPLAAADRRTNAGWHRTYSDGQEVDVKVDGAGPVPVPFPVGR